MPPHSREIAAMRSSRRNRRVGEKSPNSGCRPECSMRLPSERARQEPSSRRTVPSPEGKRHFLVRGSTSAQKISAGESRNSEELDGSSHGGNSRVRWSGRGVRPQARTAWVHRGEVTPASIAPMPRWLLVSWRIRLQSFSRRAGGDRDLGPRRQLPSIQDCNRAGQNLMLSAHETFEPSRPLRSAMPPRCRHCARVNGRRSCGLDVRHKHKRRYYPRRASGNRATAVDRVSVVDQCPMRRALQ